MTDETAYTPPKIWTWTKENGGQFANINRPMAGPTHKKDLPAGRHLLQLGARLMFSLKAQRRDMSNTGDNRLKARDE